MSITQYEFYKKYRYLFDDLRDFVDLRDTMLELSRDVSKEEAYKNLRKWFLTDDLEIISDFLTLIENYFDDEFKDYLKKEFAIEDISQDEELEQE